MASTDPICLVCSRPLTYCNMWSGEIKDDYVCLRCALTMVGFWQDGFSLGRSHEQVAGPSRRPAIDRVYHQRRSDQGSCSICAAQSVTLELVYDRALCADCLSTLGESVNEWRKRTP